MSTMSLRSVRKMFGAVALVPALSIALTTSASAANWVVKPDASPVTFLATGKPGFLKIRGEGARLEGAGKIEGNVLTGQFEVGLASLVTGIELRDEHMKEKYLETGKFPKATLVLDALTVDPAASKEYDFSGKLTVKGVEKPVSGKLKLGFPSANDATGEATFPIKLSDYPIGVPSHLGVTVAESVEVKVGLGATRQP